MNGYFPIPVFLVAAFLASLCSTQKLLSSGFTSEEQKKGIVSHHNELRNSVASGSVPTQPQAENMRELSWDDELAAQAQKWADNMEFKHDPNLVNGKGKPVGQNLALMSLAKYTHSPYLKEMVQGWFDEVKNPGYNGVFSPGSGHYSQLVWGNTYKVGCGYSEYSTKGFVHQYLVCNYFPAGNVMGYPPYDYGPVDCPNHHLFQSLRYNNLCSES